MVFLLTTGDVLDASQQAAFETYIRAGHGYVGVHSAADTERGWPWYGRLVGAWSSGHPEIQSAVVQVTKPTDASTAGLPARWLRTDEWYGFLRNPRTNGVRVLLTLDESTYLPGGWAMGADHPIAWKHEFDGGRAWYTEGGHTPESYSEPLFLGHLLGGIQYALARPKAVRAEAPRAGADDARRPRRRSCSLRRPMPALPGHAARPLANDEPQTPLVAARRDGDRGVRRASGRKVAGHGRAPRRRDRTRPER